MSNKELAPELEAIRKILEELKLEQMRVNSKSERDWLITYYAAIKEIPQCFNDKEWDETEKVIYDSVVQEARDSFIARGLLRSGMEKKLLELLKAEHEKFLDARRREKERC